MSARHEHVTASEADAYVRGELPVGRIAAIGDYQNFCVTCSERVEAAWVRVRNEDASS
jgi:hypothetical protein